MSHLTKEQVQELKAVIRTGEPIAMIADRLAPMYNKPVHSFRCTLYNLAKRTYKIAKWNGPKKRKLNTTKKEKAKPQQLVLALDAPPAKPEANNPRIEKYADHIRIYF